MSLINDVLRDLDQRNAVQAERGGIPHDVRALPATTRPRWRSPLAAVAGLCALAAAAWMLRSGESAAPQPSPTVAARTTISSPASTAAATPASPQPVAPSTSPTPSAVPPPLYFDEPLAAPPSVVPAASQASAAEAMRASPAPAGDARPAPRRETRLRLEGQLRSPVAPQVAAAPADDWVQTQASLRGATPATTEATLKSFMGAHPGHVAARQALVTALLQGNRVAEAVPVLRDGLAAAPEQVGWAMTLARIQAGSNDYSAAYETLAKSAAHAQALPDYQAFVGTVLQRLDRAAEALTHYEAALRARPQEARWWVGYGIALEAAGRMADAREAYARARGIGGLTAEVRQFVDERLR